MALEKIKQFLTYNPQTGHFTWLERRGPNAAPGQVAGRPNRSGYLRVGFSGREYLSNRLAWWFVHGEWPSTWVDHINGIRTDNRIANLRLVTLTQSGHNSRVKKNSTTGRKGVTPKGNRFVARIRFGGKRIQIGSFATAEEAAEAYRTTALTLQGEYAPIE